MDLEKIKELLGEDVPILLTVNCSGNKVLVPVESIESANILFQRRIAHVEIVTSPMVRIGEIR